MHYIVRCRKDVLHEGKRHISKRLFLARASKLVETNSQSVHVGALFKKAELDQLRGQSANCRLREPSPCRKPSERQLLSLRLECAHQSHRALENRGTTVS